MVPSGCQHFKGLPCQPPPASSSPRETVGSDNTAVDWRLVVDQFWKFARRQEILRGALPMMDNNLLVLPTHVTERCAPPDHISFVQFDYPIHLSLGDLVQEHTNKMGVTATYRRVGTVHKERDHRSSQRQNILPLRGCLHGMDLFFPALQYYPPNGRHSVGVTADNSTGMEWHDTFPMTQDDAIVFDCEARNTPHVSAGALWEWDVMTVWTHPFTTIIPIQQMRVANP